MAKYEVEIKLVEIYFFDEIEADSEQEAGEKADAMLDGERAKAKYHRDSDGEINVFEL